MLGVEVTGLTLVYAEKVKFIAFTFPAPHLRRSFGIVVVLLALVPAVLRVADGRVGWPEALFILAGAGFIIFHATRLVLLQRLARTRSAGGAASTGSGTGGGPARRRSPLIRPQAAV